MIGVLPPVIRQTSIADSVINSCGHSVADCNSSVSTVGTAVVHSHSGCKSLLVGVPVW
jgi:hypothetical protein